MLSLQLAIFVMKPHMPKVHSRQCQQSVSNQKKAGNHRQNGFSVLEALVAIALIAGAFLPLLALQAQLTRTAIAVERAEETLRAKSNAVAYIRTLNPTQRPSGEEDLGNAIMVWTSQIVAGPQQARSMAGEGGRYDMALYDVSIELRFISGRVDQFTVRQVGWIATRPIGDIG